MIKSTIVLFASATALTACTSAVAPVTLEVAAASYSAPALPQAAATPAIDPGATMTRIAFGSCNHQHQPQGIWSVINAANPDAFLMIGDNVYGDYGWEGDAAMRSFVNAYAKQAADPGFTALRQSVPTLASWDDHDFGPNDAGGTFAFRERSEDLFESFWGASETVRSRPGIYDSVIAGAEGQRVQIVMLDTRFFRSSLKRLPYSRERRPLGNYNRDPSPDAEMLGQAQWAWLAEELTKPADLRVLVSSIQVLTDAHRYESWANMPAEREKLMQTLAARNGGGLVMLSGDRHVGAVYSDTPDALGEPVWELTSSSLNLAFGSGDVSEREPDPERRSPLIADENFGLVDIDWAARTFTLGLRAADGSELVSETVAF